MSFDNVDNDNDNDNVDNGEDDQGGRRPPQCDGQLSACPLRGQRRKPGARSRKHKDFACSQ